MRRMTKKQLTAIILPVVCLLGIVLFLTIPKGGLLKAFDDPSPLFDVTYQGKNVADLKVKENTAQIELTAKKTGTYEIPFNENQVMLGFPNFDKENIKYYENDSKNFKESLLTSDSSSSDSSSKADSADYSKIIKVANDGDPKTGTYYMMLKEGQKINLGISELSKDASDSVSVINYDNKDEKQYLVTFEKQTVQTSQSEAQKTAPATSAAKPKAEEKNEDNVLKVETKKTPKSLDSLKSQQYSPADSLVKPLLLQTPAEKAVKVNNTNADIVISQAYLSVLDGKSKFDNDDAPGHDSSQSNGIVRSWDQVTYLANFSIQNQSTNQNYTNIRYSLTATLPDAVTMMPDGKTPQVNAEIANGHYYKADGTLMDDAINSPGYSEGTVESTISDTGQVFLPIVANVFGMKNGQKIQPTFKLTLLSADKKNDDGSTETVNFNNSYDSTQFSSFSPRATTVSAKPNIRIQLQKGDTSKAQDVIQGLDPNADSDAYDVGAVAALKPLDEHSDWDNSYVGSTFPQGAVTYSFKYGGSYGGSSNGVLSPGNGMNKPSVSAYAPAIIGRTAPFKTNAGKVDVSKFSTLPVPNANTGVLYTTQPTDNLGEKGVYKSGDFSVSQDGQVNNTNYLPLYSKYIYTMQGNLVSKELSRSFSSLELVFNWNKEATKAFLGQNFAGTYSLDISVESVSYDGQTVDNTKNNSSYKISQSTQKDPPGSAPTGNVHFWGQHRPDSESGSLFKIGDQTVTGWDQANRYFSTSPDTTAPYVQFGNDLLNAGDNRIYLSGSYAEYIPKANTVDNILMWDPSALQFDESRPFAVVNTEPVQDYQIGRKINFEYGVAITNDTPWKTKTKVATLLSYEDTYNKQFKWFSTPKDARAYAKAHPDNAGVGSAYGKSDGISAVRIHFEFNLGPKNEVGVSNGVPLTVLQEKAGATTPAGNTLVGLQAVKGTNPSTNYSYDPAENAFDSLEYNKGNYLVTTFNPDGTAPLSQRPMKYWNWIGTSAFVKPFNIRTSTDVAKDQYNANDDISIKVRGMLTGSDSQSYDSALNTTLPAGINYKTGTAVDGKGNSLPEPKITQNSDGTTTLQWVFAKSDLKTGTEVDFKATSNISKLPFADTGSADLTVKTVGEMWTSNDSTNRDSSGGAARESTDVFSVHLDQQLVISKEKDKPRIEVGDTDDALSSDKAAALNDITYTIQASNNSTQGTPALSSVKLLDVLPYNGDSRGTHFKGSYKVQKVTATIMDSQGKAVPATTDIKVNYTTSAPSTSTYTEKTNPNNLSGWSEASDQSPVSADAKAILVDSSQVPIGGKIKLIVTIRPDGNQTTNDVYKNNARMNSILNTPVSSQVVTTTVYSRSLSGVAWYDDNVNGLKDANEAVVPDIPVKLYRTSNNVSSYKNQLVTKDLKGNPLIDSNGNSLIKTDSSGKYQFNNLPEGNYVAYFDIKDKVLEGKIKVTKKDPVVSSQDANTSKADPAFTSLATDPYNLPSIDKVVGSDNTATIQNVNIGLLRPNAIRIFKYETGTATDANGDGQLSDAEKQTGAPLSGAEFKLYNGDSQDPKDYVATGTTGTYGNLQFDNLFAGEYTLVETKAPKNHELLKKPIKVTVKSVNETIMVYVANDKKTELPHAGGNNPMLLILIGASVIILLGFGSLFYYYRISNRKGSN